MTLKIDNDRPVPRVIPPAQIINGHNQKSYCMDAGFLYFNCRKIVSSLTCMPSRCIKYSAGRPPILCQPSPQPCVQFVAYRVKQSQTTCR